MTVVGLVLVLVGVLALVAGFGLWYLYRPDVKAGFGRT
jgi:hypothetical protein